MDINSEFLNQREFENDLIEKFGDRFLTDAVRVLSSRRITPPDIELIHEALSILIAMYLSKVKSGEIEQDRVLH